MDHQIVYPIDMDEYAWWETEQKGWLEVTVRWAAGEQVVTFYDPTRLLQTVNASLSHQGYFAERIVVVPRLTRDAVESVVTTMARHDFVGMP